MFSESRYLIPIDVVRKEAARLLALPSKSTYSKELHRVNAELFGQVILLSIDGKQVRDIPIKALELSIDDLSNTILIPRLAPFLADQA